MRGDKSMHPFDFNLVIGAVVVCSLIVGGEGGPLFTRSATDLVLEKLENLNKGASKSGLTLVDLDAAYSEYKSWPDLTLVELKTKDNLVQFLIHFLYLPMEKFPLHGNSVEKLEVQKHFIERLERNYRRFKPGYLGRTTSNAFVRSPKTSILESSLFRLSGHNPLTKLMFQQAKQEYEAIKGRTEEMAEYDDVYAYLGELESNLNYLNRAEVQLLAKSIFPAFEAGLQMGKFEPEYLTNLFQVQMVERGIVSRDGTLYALPTYWSERSQLSK